MAKPNKSRACEKCFVTLCVVINKYNNDDDMMIMMMMTIKVAMVRPKKARACKRFFCVWWLWCHSQTTQWPDKERANVWVSLVSVWWSLILCESKYNVYLDEKDELSELPGYGEGQATESGNESPWYCGIIQWKLWILWYISNNGNDIESVEVGNLVRYMMASWTVSLEDSLLVLAR